MRWLVLTLILLWSIPAHSQAPNPDDLKNLTKAAEDARKREAELSKKRKTIQSEIDGLKKQLVKTAKEAASFEKESISLESTLTRLSQKEIELKEKIYTDREALMRLLAALQRIENNPPPPLASRPEDATNAARAEKLMSSLSLSLKSRADELSEKLAESQTLQSQIKLKHKSLSANEKSLSKKRQKISNLVTQKTDLEKSVSKDQENASLKVKKLASEAKSLRELIDSFESATLDIQPRIKPDKNAPNPRSSVTSKPVKLPKGVTQFAKAKGKLRAPISGPIVRKYGNGEKGITLGGRSKAQVISPYAGRVEFSGAFKNYDNVVILNVGDGYFILLTGLGETYVETNENIKTGEPIGLLPFKAKGTADLYIEFRKNGKTINPKPWLGAALASG